MISIRNLSIAFDENVVFQNISIDFESVKVHGIVGLNGAGKTTFFNCLARSIKPDSGSIQLDDGPLTIDEIAYLETSNFFYSLLTGNEYLKIFKQTNAAFDLRALQDFFKLPLHDLIETYSTGMKKKLALLGVLKQNKRVFLLDEPFNGLDIETNKVLEVIIGTLKSKGKTVFVSSHIIDPLLSVCDVIHVIENGVFSRSFEKVDFHKIETELFQKLKDHAQAIVARSI